MKLIIQIGREFWIAKIPTNLHELWISPESYDGFRPLMRFDRFYMHFGTDEEIEREKAWYVNFSPNGRLHNKRDGRYDRT